MIDTIINTKDLTKDLDSIRYSYSFGECTSDDAGMYDSRSEAMYYLKREIDREEYHGEAFIDLYRCYDTGDEDRYGKAVLDYDYIGSVKLDVEDD